MCRLLKLLCIQRLIKKLVKSTCFILACQILLVFPDDLQIIISDPLQISLCPRLLIFWSHDVTILLDIFIISSMILSQFWLGVKVSDCVEIWTFYNFMNRQLFIDFEKGKRSWVINKFLIREDTFFDTEKVIRDNVILLLIILRRLDNRGILLQRLSLRGL